MKKTDFYFMYLFLGITWLYCLVHGDMTPFYIWLALVNGLKIASIMREKNSHNNN